MSTKKAEGLFELFNFANLLSLIVGIFLIAFGAINLTVYHSILKWEYLVFLTTTGFILFIFAIFGFLGIK